MAIKTAIIGLGRIAWMLEQDPKREKPCTHMGAVSQLPELELYAAADIKKKRLNNFAREYDLNKSQLYGDGKELLEQSSPDLLIISSWTDSHFDLLQRAIRKDIAVIVGEKPMTFTAREARKIMELLAKHPTRLIINHERRYSHRYRDLFRMVQGNKLGQIHTIRGTVTSGIGKNFSQRYEISGGPLLHDGTHLIDLMVRLAPQMETIQAWGEFHSEQKRISEKWITAQIMSREGTALQLEIHGNSRYFHFELDVWGSQGRFIIGNGYERLYLAQKSPYYEGFQSLGRSDYHAGKGTSPFLSLYQEIVLYFQSNKGRRFVFQSEAKEAYQVMEVIQAIYKSATKNGKKIALQKDFAHDK